MLEFIINNVYINTQYSTDSNPVEDSSTPSETPRPVTESSSDGSSVIVIVAPVSTAGTLLVFTTIAVLLIVLLKWHCEFSLSVCSM